VRTETAAALARKPWCTLEQWPSAAPRPCAQQRRQARHADLHAAAAENRGHPEAAVGHCGAAPRAETEGEWMLCSCFRLTAKSDPAARPPRSPSGWRPAGRRSGVRIAWSPAGFPADGRPFAVWSGCDLVARSGPTDSPTNSFALYPPIGPRRECEPKKRACQADRCIANRHNMILFMWLRRGGRLAGRQALTCDLAGAASCRHGRRRYRRVRAVRPRGRSRPRGASA